MKWESFGALELRTLRIMAKRKGTFRPDPPKREAQPLGDILADWLDRSGILRSAQEAAVRDAWNETVGPAIAARTELRGLRRGVLHVTVDSASLRQELASFAAASILRSINSKLTDSCVSEIRFKTGAIGREKSEDPA